MNKKSLITILALLVSLMCIGEEYKPEFNDPFREDWRWIDLEYFKGKGVRCILEDNNNIIWISTNIGLIQYDGYDYTIFQEENSVLSTTVFNLFQDKNNVIYAVSIKGIAKYENKQWKDIMLFSEELEILGLEWETINIEETSNGDLYFAFKFGLVKVKQDGSIRIYTNSTMAKTLSNHVNYEIITLDHIYKSIEDFTVFEILNDNNNNLWLGLEDGRILRFNNFNNRLEKKSDYTIYNNNNGIEISRLPILHERKGGDIIYATQSVNGGVGIYSISLKSWSFFKPSVKFNLANDIIFSITEFGDNNMMLGGLGVLLILDNKKNWKKYDVNDIPISPTRILAYEDNNKKLWILGLLSDVHTFESKTDNWLSLKNLNFQCETKNGIQWFITGNGEMVTCNSNTQHWAKLNNSKKIISSPNAIYKDSKENIWVIGSHNQQAAVAVLKDGNWQLKTFPDLCWGFNLDAFLETKDNSIWLGSAADCGDDKKWGIVQYIPQSGSIQTPEAWNYFFNDSFSMVAYDIGETYYGSVIIGSYLGLLEKRPGQTVTELDKTLNNDVIKTESIENENDSILWIGTRSHGVIKYVDKDNWKQFTLDNGLTSNFISNIHISSDKTIWASTDKSICRFDGYKWLSHALPNNFSISRNGGTIRESRDGSIWINQHNISWITRNRFSNTPESAPPSIITYKFNLEKDEPQTTITLFEEKVLYPGNTIIFWEGKDAWEQTPVSEIEYSYRLNNDNWSEFSKDKSHYFLKLKRGKYTLQVRARDKALNIDNTPAEIKFKVLPPLWGYWWFITIVVSIVIIIIYQFINALRKRAQIEEKNKEFEKKNNELAQQQKEIQDKSEQILQLLEEEKKKKWINDGLVKVSEIIKNNQDEIKNLCYNFIITLSEYLEIHYAVIFLKIKNKKNEEILQIMAQIGLGRENMNKTFKVGEGLTGAAYKENEMLIINKLADNYITESGLGGAKLKQLAIFPIKTVKDKLGILELGSFEEFSPEAIELVQASIDNIASAINILETKLESEQLYKESKGYMAQLVSQEEELKQNLEEMTATQEEYERTKQRMLKNETQLKEEILKHKKTIKVLEKKLKESI